ncbi:predicted protein [Chaetomium globosum CBS 148.51]|uniref:Uncharacterized protein n=1 Tax=Chaetomium globosum (strain ATCC 6205 / CBS 148.51 / DSM 1962 / NBRC 6347 / NRRL 1970) TaxID=306901 RepID=Q2GQM8_CHAGB|nr:uncharacterized protein CHGG_09726 [Chaetomium globosum CBS 148.51]EAQ83322.1 predicted protein [Chaetomium globosum CBS 148.51]
MEKKTPPLLLPGSPHTLPAELPIIAPTGYMQGGIDRKAQSTAITAPQAIPSFGMSPETNPPAVGPAESGLREHGEPIVTHRVGTGWNLPLHPLAMIYTHHASSHAADVPSKQKNSAARWAMTSMVTSTLVLLERVTLVPTETSPSSRAQLDMERRFERAYNYRLILLTFIPHHNRPS